MICFDAVNWPQADRKIEQSLLRRGTQVAEALPGVESTPHNARVIVGREPMKKLARIKRGIEIREGVRGSGAAGRSRDRLRGDRKSRVVDLTDAG
jgi:hypothetical protein